MSYAGPYLLDTNNSELFYFGNRTEFLIGRGCDTALDIKSKFISRNQCLIKYTAEKTWVIQDLSSFKSTRVNRNPIKCEWQILNNCDLISFVNYTENEYIFYKDSTYIPATKKRKLPEVIEIDDIPSASDVSDLKKVNTRLLAQIERLAEEKKILNDNYQKVAGILEATQKSLESMDVQKTTLSLKLIDLNEVNESLAVQLQNQIEALRDCELELERVVSEKAALQETMKNVIVGDYISEFNAMKEELEAAKKELTAKDGRLNEVFAEKDILSTNISDLLEQEFSCSVCSEVLFQTTTLQCRHTFCAKCVATWKRKKKECPVCRTKIKTEVMPLVIDSFIDKLTELIGGEFKKRREDIRKERASNKPGDAVSPYNYHQSSRTRARRISRGTPRRPERSVATMSTQPRNTFSDHLQRLLDFTQPLTIDLTNTPSRLVNRR